MKILPNIVEASRAYARGIINVFNRAEIPPPSRVAIHPRIIPAWRDKIARGGINLFFPLICSVCSQEISESDCNICPQCLSNLLQQDASSFCVKCGVPLFDGGEHCYNCLNSSDKNIKYIRACCSYKNETVKTLVHKFKYFNRDFLSRAIAKIMLDRFVIYFKTKEIDILIPVPMFWIKKYLRGYNQSELLAAEISRNLAIPVNSEILVKNKYLKPQVKLNKTDRLKNIQGAIKVKNIEMIKGKNILLIDDVCTTGSTLKECARVLKQSGANNIYGYVFARG